MAKAERREAKRRNALKHKVTGRSTLSRWVNDVAKAKRDGEWTR